jgi:hypothetical protein
LINRDVYEVSKCVKRCKWDFRVCGCRSCSTFDLSSGNIDVCSRHRNPSGYLTARLPAVSRWYIFSKHDRGGS